MATAEQTIREIQTELRKIADPSKLLLTLATQQRSSSKTRIFTDGETSFGGPIGTYKDSTIKSKKRKGRFTSSKINLRDTEQLADAYQIEVRGKKRVVLGFSETRDKGSNSEIVDSLEDRFGIIFAPTEQEFQEQDLIIDSFTKNLF